MGSFSAVLQPVVTTEAEFEHLGEPIPPAVLAYSSYHDYNAKRNDGNRLKTIVPIGRKQSIVKL